MADISKIKLPDGITYEIKDSVARSAIAQGVSFHIATDAASTPKGVTWDDHGTTIVGTLVASDQTLGFYLVPATTTSGKDIYAEYVAIDEGGGVYIWEKLGDTEVQISVELRKVTDNVLGADTTFTNSSSSVTFTGGTSDTFVKSYPGVTNKLETTTIKGVGPDVTFNAVSGTPGTVTATNTVFGTNTSASKITTESKTATNTVLGTAKTASKATAGTAVTLAKPASSATSVSRISLSSGNTTILEKATVASGSETLVIGTASVDNSKSITGTNGSETITPYTFADVTVPVISSNSEVSIASVKTNDSITVPVVSSNTQVTASEQITVSATTAATSAANATRVATGSLKSTDTVGATIMTGLGTATTASAVTSIGTGTAAAQTITVGTNDIVTALTDDTDIIVS